MANEKKVQYLQMLGDFFVDRYNEQDIRELGNYIGISANDYMKKNSTIRETVSDFFERVFQREKIYELFQVMQENEKYHRKSLPEFIKKANDYLKELDEEKMGETKKHLEVQSDSKNKKRDIVKKRILYCYYKTSEEYVNIFLENLKEKSIIQPMEVSKDLFESVKGLLKKRIEEEQLLEYVDENLIQDSIYKGFFTYKQVRHMTQFGLNKIFFYNEQDESISVSSVLGISAYIQYAWELWKGETKETALKNGIRLGIASGRMEYVNEILEDTVPQVKEILGKESNEEYWSDRWDPNDLNHKKMEINMKDIQMMSEKILISDSASEMMSAVGTSMVALGSMSTMETLAAGAMIGGFTPLLLPSAGLFGIAFLWMSRFNSQKAKRKKQQMILDEVNQQLNEMRMEYLLNEKEMEDVVSDLKNRLMDKNEIKKCAENDWKFAIKKVLISDIEERIKKRIPIEELTKIQILSGLLSFAN